MRRLILSRKGWDSSFGGGPSPILPDSSLVSFPIPAGTRRKSPHRFDDLFQAHPQASLLKQLIVERSRGKVGLTDYAHLDPLLTGKTGVLGQVGAADSHLRKHGVTGGDLFLFFGWFSAVDPATGPVNVHILFGWLQLQEVKFGKPEEARKWFKGLDHPHLVDDWGKGSSFYVGKQELMRNGKPTGLPGFGLFRRYDPRLCLTATGCSRSIWSLPPCFQSQVDRPTLSYHGNRARWSGLPDGRIRLASVGRGQEFVLAADKRNGGVSDWAYELIRELS